MGEISKCMNRSLRDCCLQENLEHLLKEWDAEKNAHLTPDDVMEHSKEKVWWKCEKGHSWQAVVYSRVDGTGCPICAGRKILVGFNDFATTHPELAKQWHPTKNGSLTPQQVVFGTNRKIWWQCENNHAWPALIRTRARGIGCPFCANKFAVPGENDLESQFPDLAAQWLQSKNGKLTPRQVVFGSNRIVWWQCDKGHQWRTSVVLRTQRGYGCPYCAGQYVLAGFNDLQYLRPEIAKEWHSTLNGDLTPDQVTVSSNRIVWWECGEGHVWKTAVYNRTAARPTNCPVCAGNITTKKRLYYERIAREAALKGPERKEHTVFR